MALNWEFSGLRDFSYGLDGDGKTPLRHFGQSVIQCIPYTQPFVQIAGQESATSGFLNVWTPLKIPS
jgi:hypothetical protein